MKKPIRIVITTGDTDGIGSEIAAKALYKMGPKPGVQFYIWRSPRCPTKHLRILDRGFKRKTVSSWAEALNAVYESPKQLVDISSNLPPPVWVETSAKASLFGHVDALATAPLSKTSIVSAGLRDIGHTDILKRVTSCSDLFMGFIGTKFHVLLATGHLALADVPSALSALRLELATRAAFDLRKILPKKWSSRPVALLGLNPHAGEQGLIGKEESSVHASLLKKLQAERWPIVGPLVPDAAFFPANWELYSVFVANYHDQGLIPFKMIHGQESGVHITLGLPFVRTSVDHGTAKNLFGKDKADPSSMRLAIEWALRLAKARKEEK